MKLSKSQRAELRNKFGGLCAYCGHELPERWHADHLEPVVRNWGEYAKERPAMRPDNHRIENMMPACPPCNLSKHSMSLEGWRKWLSGHVNSLNQYHPIYRLAKAYGLIQETGAEVVFYFERASTAHQQQEAAGHEQ